MSLKRIYKVSEKTKRILEERKTGKSIIELAKIYGVSKQRVYAILKRFGDTLPKKYQK